MTATFGGMFDGATQLAVDDHVADMRMKSLSPNTIHLRVLCLRRLAAFVAPTPLLQVTEAQLRRYQRAMVGDGMDRAGLAAETRRAYVCNLRVFYEWAFIEGLIGSNPAGVLIIPKVPRGKPKPMPEDDLTLALAGSTPRIRVWLILAAGAGLRAMEIAGLEREDVRDEASIPHLVIRGKGDRERLVPLAPWVLTALQEYGMPASGPLFSLIDGRPVEPKHVSNRCNKHLYTLGIRFSLHKLRHRFATQLYKSTRDLRLVQEALGHVSPATTVRYTDYDHDAAATAIAGLTAGGAA